MIEATAELVDFVALRRIRGDTGSSFTRILAYFREDGGSAIARMEEAVGGGHAAALILPAHTLTGESLQFGANRLALAAEHIGILALQFVDRGCDPGLLAAEVGALRPLFDASLAAIELASGAAAITQDEVRPAQRRRVGRA